MTPRRNAAGIAFALLMFVAACGGEDAADKSAAKPARAGAPGFEVQAFTAGSEKLELGALLDKGPVVVNFFESWCPTCANEQRDINATAKAYTGRVSFVGLNNKDTVADGLGYAEMFKVPYPMAHAPEVWKAYGVPVQPVTVVIGKDGREVKRWAGAVTAEQLAEALDAALAG